MQKVPFGAGKGLRVRISIASGPVDGLIQVSERMRLKRGRIVKICVRVFLETAGSRLKGKVGRLGGVVQRRSYISEFGGARLGPFAADFTDALQPFACSSETSWEVSMELWSNLYSDSLKTILESLLSNVFIEITNSVSLLGEGAHCYFVGTMHGLDVVHDTTLLIESLLRSNIQPLALGIDTIPCAEEARLQASHYYELDEPGLAARYYEMAINGRCTSIDSGHLYLLAGLAHKESGNLSKAKARLEEVESLTDNCSILADSFQHLAAVEHAEGNHNRALQHSSKALACDPESGIKLFNIANAYCLLGRTEMALRYLEEALGSRQKLEVLEHVLVDIDFEELRKTPGFRSILESVSD